jgi:alpha-tubulin suppressor-like RCC1 family protein/phosphoheptose isomerase
MIAHLLHNNQFCTSLKPQPNQPFLKLILMKKLIFILLATCFHFAVQAQSVSSGDRHSLWLKCSGTIPEAFGYNNLGQLGNDTSGVYEQSTPVMINSTTGMIAISTGSHHSLFLRSDGTVWACGNNSNGELGDGTTINRDSPVQVTGLTNVVAISGGHHHSLFLKSDGTVWACGRNSDGQLGDGTTTQRTTAVQVSGLTNIIAIAGGGYHSLFLKNDSTVWACGENGSGQLGDGTTTQRTTAVQVSTLTSIAAISGGMEHSVFLKSDGTPWATGRNHNGQLGDGTTTNRLTAVQVSGLTSITALDAGYHYSLFLKSNGTAWGCGNNVNGQLGDGTNTNRLTAVQVNDVVNVASLSAGWAHSLFLLSNASVWACGTNYFGDLGDGTTVDQNSPVQTIDIGLPEINVKGNNVNIVAGDITPAASDHTNFGNVAINTSPTRTYTIQNLGTNTLFISSITSNNALFTASALMPTGSIAAGGSATFVLTFSPTTTGQKNATLTINNTDCDEGAYTYAIRGTGVTTCPTLTFNETHNEACIGSTDGVITLSGSSGGSGPYTFSKDSGVTFQNNNAFSNLAPGIYQMRNKDMNGCVSAAVAVNVNDQTPPTIVCPPNITTYQNIFDSCKVTYADSFPIITDNCLLPLGGGGAPAPLTIKKGGFTFWTGNSLGYNGSGGLTTDLPLGTNYLTYVATDSVGNTDSCIQTIIVLDTLAPLFEPVFNNYAFATATGVLLEDISIGATEIIPAGSDNVSSSVQTIPFYFDFQSVVYRNFSVSSNGLIGFGTNVVTTSAANSTTANQHNKIYACWDNLHTGTDGSVKYKVIGSTPNRKLVIEFNVRNAAETGNFTKTCQVWLYEGSHNVQLVYGAGTSMPSATIGVRGANATSYNEVSTSNHSSSRSVVNDNNTAWPGSGRSYLFSPAIFATAASGTCGATVTFGDPGFIDCNGTGWTCTAFSGDNFPVGTTQLVYTVSDFTEPPNMVAMNTATYSIPVIVEDAEAPVINCIGGAGGLNNYPGSCYRFLTIETPTITDNCGAYIVNNALNFDGFDDLVKVPPTSVINTTSQNKRTVEVSFRVVDKSISSRKQVLWEEGGTANGLNLYIYNGSLYVGLYSVSNGWNGVWLSTSAINNNQWHHVALVYDGTISTDRLLAYLDGVQFGSANSSVNLGTILAQHASDNGVGGLTNSGKFHDGNITASTGHSFQGDIDEVRVWNTARTASELSATLATTLNGSETGLRLYYTFNQGNACGGNSMGSDFLDDQTTANINGTLFNMELGGYEYPDSTGVDMCLSNWTVGSPQFNNSITITNNFNGKTYASGYYPVGSTDVIWTATDKHDNISTCSTLVTIYDDDSPFAITPGDQILNMDANTCTASYSIPNILFDNCFGGVWGYYTTGATSLGSMGYFISQGSSSSVLTFNKGVTVVHVSGMDIGSIPSNLDSFTVTVVDNQPPVLTSPGNQTRNVIANTCAANYTIADPFSDNCTGGSWGYSTTGATTLTSSGNTRNDGQSSGVLSFNKGVTTVTLTGTDGTNAATSVTFTVTVNDNQIPTIVAPANQTLNVIANTCAANYTIADPFSDNCTGGNWGYSTTGATVLTSTGNTRSDGQNSGVLSFNKGVTTVTLTGTDGTNTATSVTFTVTVNDNQAPTLVAPANQTLNVIANTCAANYTIADPFSDNCTGGIWGYSTTGATTLTSSGNTRNDGQSSGVLSFNKGVTTVTLTGTDGTNTATSVTFTVTVNDNQAPTLVAPSNQTLNTISGTCAANYNILDPISDNCTGASWGYTTTGATVLTSSGNTRNDGQNSGVKSFNKGVTIVTLTGTDGSNAATSVTFSVTVNDNQNPTLTCPANQVLNTTTCSALYTITDPVSDNCPGATWGYSLTGATQAAVSGISDGANSNPIVFSPGTTVVSLHGQDASLNGAIGCTFTVTVNSSTCTQTINLTLFLQGFYTGNSTMAPALFNQGVSAPLTTTDSITVNLIALDGTTVIASTQSTLQTNGTVVSTFFPAQFGYYYLSVKHRNSIETYTSSAMYVDANTTYDFTNTALKAFGSNQIEVENGVWAFYSGDINQDYSIDAFDYVQLDPDIINGVFGYTVTDLTGDGYVDAFDYIILDANLINGVGVITP